MTQPWGPGDKGSNPGQKWAPKVAAAGVAGGLPVWTGTAWKKQPIRVWDGAAWRGGVVKTWTGSYWKVLP